MVTRAKCLLVVVGNRETLSLDSNWKKFIDFCENNDAIVDSVIWECILFTWHFCRNHIMFVLPKEISPCVVNIPSNFCIFLSSCDTLMNNIGKKTLWHIESWFMDSSGIILSYLQTQNSLKIHLTTKCAVFFSIITRNFLF